MESQIKSKSVMYITTKSWDSDILESDLLVFVDFWSEWCGPCRMITPAIEQLAQVMNGRLKVAKINVDENQEIAMKYGIQLIPLLLLFKDGKEIARTVGAAPKKRI
jgi:thioredoxin 1